MAKDSDDDVKKPKRGERTAGWILTGLLVLGLGGFGVQSFTGGTIVNIGSVGDVDISAKNYGRAIQQQMARVSQQLGVQVDAATAQAFGLFNQALSSVVTAAALDNEAQKIGLSVGDDTVAAEIRKQAAFQGTAGTFDRQAYAMVLDRNGWTEAEYEETLRGDAARSLLQGAVTGGFIAPAATTDALYAWAAERRGFSLIHLSEADLAEPVPEPTDEELKAWYDGHIADFTRPEAIRLRYAALLPDAIAKDQPVDEATLRKLYDERIDEFVEPERRLVERLVYPDAAARDAALAEAEAGARFEDLVAARGLTLDAVDLGDVSEHDLGAAAAAVFAADEGAVIAAESDLGPALFRVNGKLDGQNVSFEEARADLAAEMQIDAAKRAISARVEGIDDLLAGGATLDELANDEGMTLGTIDYVPGRQGDDKITGYQAFREAADKLKEGDFPEAVMLDDGGVVTMEYVEAVPSAPIPLDEVRDAVAEAWHADALARALAAQAQTFKTAAEGGAALGTLGIVDRTAEIGRDGTVRGAPDGLLHEIFAMTEGEIRIFEDGDFVALVRLDAIVPAAQSGEGADAMKAAIAGQFEQAFAEDAFAAFATAVTDGAGISLDQSAINAVNTSVQ